MSDIAVESAAEEETLKNRDRNLLRPLPPLRG